MQIQAIIQEIVCIIDEDGSDRFDFTKMRCVFLMVIWSDSGRSRIETTTIEKMRSSLVKLTEC